MADELGATPPAPGGSTGNQPAPGGNAPAPNANGNSNEPNPAAPSGKEPAPAADKAGNWPDDWRTRSGRGDEKRVKRLERYASPEAAIDALFAAQDKISSGQLTPTLKPDATAAEIKAWRESNGIPETPEGYDLTLPNGLVIGENDKPFVDDFVKAAHSANYRPEEVKSAVAWFFNHQETLKENQLEAIANRVAETEDILRQEYGGDYRKNLAIANSFVAGAPPDVQRELYQAQLPDGTLLGDSPHFARWIVNMAREMNPIGSVVPSSGTNAVQAVETELGGLRKMMGDHQSEYWKGPNAAKNQARYLELTEALQKGKGR